MGPQGLRALLHGVAFLNVLQQASNWLDACRTSRNDPPKRPPHHHWLVSGFFFAENLQKENAVLKEAYIKCRCQLLKANPTLAKSFSETKGKVIANSFYSIWKITKFNLYFFWGPWRFHFLRFDLVGWLVCHTCLDFRSVSVSEP